MYWIRKSIVELLNALDTNMVDSSSMAKKYRLEASNTIIWKDGINKSGKGHDFKASKSSY